MALILPNDLANQIPADGEKLQQNFTTIENWANQEAITRDGSRAMTGALLLAGPPTQPGHAASKEYVDGGGGGGGAGGLVGEIRMFAGDVEPSGWMFCRGWAISRATYASLFAVIGVRFGTGDGSTTFNIPDYQGRVPVGQNNTGVGIFTGGVGERAGYVDAIVPHHLHPVNIVSTTFSTDHSHSYSGQTTSATTGGGSPVAPAPAHSHTADPLGQGWDGYVVWDAAGQLGGWSMQSGTGIGVVGSTSVGGGGGGGGGGGSESHAHNYSGSTGGQSAHHTHSVNGSTENAGGAVSGNNMNIQPSLNINFMIRAF